MENIELALLTVISSGKTSGQGELSCFDAKTEGGFAGVLAGQEERVEVDSKNNTIVPLKRDEKQTDKVEPEKRDKYNEQSRISTDDSEDADVEIRGENFFQEAPSPEVLSEEILIAGTFLGEELSQIAENEGHDAGNPEPVSKLTGLLESQGDQLQQNVAFDHVPAEMGMEEPFSGKTLRSQNDLLAGIKDSNDETQVSFVVDEEGSVFNDGEKQFLGTEVDAVAGNRADKIKHSEIQINIIKKYLGNINESDVEQAVDLKAHLIGFNVKILPKAETLSIVKKTKFDVK